MNTILFENKGKIKMIAHRGLSGLEKENTCPAFVAAGVKSYYGIETDVHITKDGKFIIVHDDDLKRVANLDMSVENSNFSDLRAVRMTDTDGVTERADLFLPSLEEYISICKKYDKECILELKNKMPEEKIWEIAQTAQNMGWLERVTFISFSAENLLALREKYPRASAQYLTELCLDEEIEFMINNRLDADLCGYCVTKERVDRLHEAGLRVNVWTLDTLEHAEMAKAFGVDMITTNILE
ncbi:MAG: hypothetical protein E7381_01635 [Clostridiales bacterium]|nr:hypothetical protein [Clostridiales bacterium]